MVASWTLNAACCACAMDEARLRALATRIAQLEAAQNAGDARLDVVAKAVEEATVEQGQAAAAVAAQRT